MFFHILQLLVRALPSIASAATQIGLLATAISAVITCYRNIVGLRNQVWLPIRALATNS